MADCFGEIGNSSNYVETIPKIPNQQAPHVLRLIKTSPKKPEDPNFAEAKGNARKSDFINYDIFYFIACSIFVFYCEATNISFWKVISLGGRWSDSQRFRDYRE